MGITIKYITTMKSHARFHDVQLAFSPMFIAGIFHVRKRTRKFMVKRFFETKGRRYTGR